MDNSDWIATVVIGLVLSLLCGLLFYCLFITVKTKMTDSAFNTMTDNDSRIPGFNDMAFIPQNGNETEMV